MNFCENVTLLALRRYVDPCVFERFEALKNTLRASMEVTPFFCGFIIFNIFTKMHSWKSTFSPLGRLLPRKIAYLNWLISSLELGIRRRTTSYTSTIVHQNALRWSRKLDARRCLNKKRGRSPFIFFALHLLSQIDQAEEFSVVSPRHFYTTIVILCNVCENLSSIWSHNFSSKLTSGSWLRECHS